MQGTLDTNELATQLKKRPIDQVNETEAAKDHVLLRLSSEASTTLDSRMAELRSWVLAEALSEAGRRQEDCVSVRDVEVAVSRLREGVTKSPHETLGGVLLGVSLSILISIIIDLNFPVAIALATLAGSLGGFLVARGSKR